MQAGQYEVIMIKKYEHSVNYLVCLALENTHIHIYLDFVAFFQKRKITFSFLCVELNIIFKRVLSVDMCMLCN